MMGERRAVIEPNPPIGNWGGENVSEKKGRNEMKYLCTFHGGSITLVIFCSNKPCENFS
jgi:hypothetical protein